jgi:hypothetical protein
MILLLATVNVSWTLAAEPAAPTKAEQSAAAEKKADADKNAEADKKADPADQEKKAADDAKEKTGGEKTAADKSGEKADKASPQRFIPSEQVRADFDVSFPVDI